MRPLPLILTACLLGACARSEPVDSNPSANVQGSAAAVPSTDAALADDPVTPGQWEASAEGQAQAVVFAGTDAEHRFEIGCDLRGGLVVQRPGLIARGNLALMQLRTSDVVRRLAVNAASGPRPQVEARVPYNDQLIGALLSFDEPLEVRYEGLDTLVLPPSPAVGDLVRTCQQSNASSAPAPDAAQSAEPAGTANSAEPAPPPAQ